MKNFDNLFTFEGNPAVTPEIERSMRNIMDGKLPPALARITDYEAQAMQFFILAQTLLETNEETGKYEDSEISEFVTHPKTVMDLMLMCKRSWYDGCTAQDYMQALMPQMIEWIQNDFELPTMQ